MKYRVLSVVLAAVFLLGAWALYKGDFPTIRTEEEKIAVILDYASNTEEYETHLRAWLHPVLLQDETIGDRRVLTFTDSEIDGLLGHIQFRRGILGGWQALSASYDVGPALRSFSLKGKPCRIVYAADCPPEIAHYKVQANPDYEETLMAEGDVTEPAFLHVHETDRDFFPDIHLYDAAGNELEAREYLASNQDYPSPSIGSAETDLVYGFCGLILAVGWVIAKYCWEAGNNKKEETA